MKRLNFQKGISLIVAVILLAVALIIGGGSYYFKQQAKPASKPIVVDATATWKTYTSNYLSNNFSVKYPSDFYLNISGEAPDYIGDSKSSLDTYLSNGSLQNTQVVISILSLSEDFGNNMQTLANRVGENKKDSNGSSIENLPFQSVTIDGIKSIKVINTNVVSYAIPTSAGFIWISAQPAVSAQIKTFEAMMTTFKFTNQNQTIDTSTWKTYTNTQNSYSFRYPNTKFSVQENGSRTRLLEGMGYGFEVNVIQTTDTTESWLKKEKNNGQFPDNSWISTQTTFLNYPSILLQSLPNTMQVPMDIFIIKKDNLIYEIAFSKAASDKIVVDQILSNFKFLK